MAHVGAKAASDFLDVGDGGDNTIKRFDATTGEFLGVFGGQSGNLLRGPRGLVIDALSNLWVADQNVLTSKSGAILRYSPLGDMVGALVLSSDKDAPAAPRGMILLNSFLYVADFTSAPQNKPNKPPIPGRLLKYRPDGGLAAVFTPPPGTLPTGAEFHPRAIVEGPDGKLYISNFPSPDPAVQFNLGGQVLRFDPDLGKFDPAPFITSKGGPTCNCADELNRPEGLVFGPGPDFRLFLTSFVANQTDLDKVVVFQGPTGVRPGAFVDHIFLGTSFGRSFAQALLFGPTGSLFVPITGGVSIGEVRRYEVKPKITSNFDTFVPAGGPLEMPWYLTFGNTDAATLAYTP
jgi:hypothetical protein